MSAMLGRFHEISISTPDLAASLSFYESLGYARLETLAVWPHPHGVVSDGVVTLGLHEYRFPSPSITYVHDDIDAARTAFASLGITFAFDINTPGKFNEFGFRDPGGTMVTVLERETFHVVPASRSSCGEFQAFSLPSADLAHSRLFWSRLAVTPPRFDAAGLALAFHDARADAAQMLLFRNAESARTFAAPEGTRLVSGSLST